MKLGLGSRLIVDLDFADTQDVSPRYSDVVVIFQACSVSADSVAQAWLGHLWSYA